MENRRLLKLLPVAASVGTVSMPASGTGDSRKESVMSDFIELTESEFDARFTLRRNHLNPNASWSGCMFETYGEELDFVNSQDPTSVWTLCDGDDWYILSGFHSVNRMGYLLSLEPVAEGTIIEAHRDVDDVYRDVDEDSADYEEEDDDPLIEIPEAEPTSPDVDVSWKDAGF
jgi:hypothetical protein